MKKIEELPHASRFAFDLAPRCGAKTRKGTTCLSPAVKGKKRCRMHGGAKGSGAPRGNKNALKHGYFTTTAIGARVYLRQVINDARDFMADVNN